MPDLLDLLWTHWWIAAVLLLACYGLGNLAGEVPPAFRKWLWGERPKPKSKPYRVIVEADDGWPLRSYALPQEAAVRLVNQLDRERDRDADKPA